MNNYYVVSFIRSDVTGDGVPDDVYLTGIKTLDSPFIQYITLVVRDGVYWIYLIRVLNI